MAEYRKKPVVVEALQWTGDNQKELNRWSEKHSPGSRIEVEVEGPIDRPVATGLLRIHTLEGVMEATTGDYIICGVEKELYPCREDIFLKTYEKVVFEKSHRRIP